MTRLAARACAGLVMFAFVAGPADAQVSDCSTPEYLSGFPSSPVDDGTFCEEVFRFTVATPDGDRIFRGIRDFNAGWAVPEAAVTFVERGARNAAAALSQIGDYRIDNVTLLIADDAMDLADPTGGPGLAMAPQARPTDQDCKITMFGLHASAGTRLTEYITAHEIFHCVQNASLSAAQYITAGAGGGWWGEGSAEYFTNIATPDSLSIGSRGPDFNSDVMARTPLYKMDYSMAVFFYWLDQERGPSGLMPFLHQMADSDSASAQRAHMRGVLSDDQRLNFAKAYAEGTIQHPQGGAATPPPHMHITRTITEPDTERFTLAPFTLLLGEYNHECGTWGHQLSASNPNLAARLGDQQWDDWPNEVDAREGDEARLRFVGLNTADAAEDITNDITRRHSCDPCAGSDAIDACVVGTWQMTGGGPIEWMRDQGIPITSATEGPRVVTYRSDGAYGTEPLNLSMVIRNEDFVGRIEGFNTVAAGNWSAEDGRMNICQHTGGMSGRVTTTEPDVTLSGDVSQPGAGTLTMSYSCAGGSLKTTIAMREFPPMVTNFRKIAEETPRPD